MKRVIEETKKNLESKPKAKVSEAKPPVKKSQASKVEKKADVEIKSKTKKLVAKNPVAKLVTKKITEISAKSVKQTLEKNSKIVQQSTPVTRKNGKSVKDTAVKQNAKTKEKAKLITAKEKISKPKAQQKLVVEAKSKKPETIKKPATAKQAVQAQPQTKFVAKSKKELVKNNLNAAKTKTHKKTVEIAKAEKSKTQTAKSFVSAEKSNISTPTAKSINPKKAVENIKTDKKVKLQPKSEAFVKKVKAAEQKVLAEVKIVPKKPVNKKAKPISLAVLRGKKGRYDFEVFPLDANFEAVSAIYVISKRITDKRKRGHHKLVCIGQTESIVEGIKMHKKDKCIKQNAANVICLLKEESEKNRLRIADDLREAHAISCNRQ